MMGDLNMSDRTLSYRILDGSLRDAMRTSGWPRSTYHGEIWPIFLLRIDHLFIPKDWCGGGRRHLRGARLRPRRDRGIVGPCPA